MKKHLIIIASALLVAASSMAKAIYYPVYITDVEIYRGGKLVEQKQLKDVTSTTIDMFPNGCSLTVDASEDIVPFIKESIRNRQAKNMAAVAAVAGAVSTAMSGLKSLSSRNSLTASAYAAQSVYFASSVHMQLEYMRYFKTLMDESLVLPVTCSIVNKSDELLVGNVVVKPRETYYVTNSNYCDEWRFVDNAGDVYCVSMYAVVMRDNGLMSRELGCAYPEFGKDEAKEHPGKVKRIDLHTYEVSWVDKDCEEYQTVVRDYAWDNGHNEKPANYGMYDDGNEYQ